VDAHGDDDRAALDSADRARVTRQPELSDPTVKQCCATFYGSDSARYLLGESFHPGGTQLTHELGLRMKLGPHSRVLDVASGRGTSAFYLAETFGCHVIGVDLSEENIRLAQTEAAERGLTDRVSFLPGDAEHLPLPDAGFATIVCECAFCTFPDKAAAAAEFFRVLAPGGLLGLTDLTRMPATTPDAEPELDGLLAWIACIGDAQPAERYEAWLRSARFTIEEQLDRSDCLKEMVRQVSGRLLLAEVMTGLHRLDLPGFNPAQVKQFLSSASRAIAQGELGYVLLLAAKCHVL
jgi:arsenite methyltransferase